MGVIVGLIFWRMGKDLDLTQVSTSVS
jgi:hypothetical protein